MLLLANVDTLLAQVPLELEHALLLLLQGLLELLFLAFELSLHLSNVVVSLLLKLTKLFLLLLELLFPVLFFVVGLVRRGRRRAGRGILFLFRPVEKLLVQVLNLLIQVFRILLESIFSIL